MACKHVNATFNLVIVSPSSTGIGKSGAIFGLLVGAFLTVLQSGLYPEPVVTRVVGCKGAPLCGLPCI